MNLTRNWINQLERSSFPAFDDTPVFKDTVYSFIVKSTVMNELMHNHSADYVREFVDDMYKSPSMNLHGLKRFIILDYPLSIIESIFKQEHKKRIRSIQAGLYPFEGGQVLTACATLSPFGEGVIFFSEWLFTFLWDYFHSISEISQSYILNADAKNSYQSQVRKIKDKFLIKLSTGKYKNWDINNVLTSNQNTNSQKYDLLFALIFIWAHELGHIFLSHFDASNMKELVFLSNDGKEHLLPVYNIDQEHEYDADMFASDIYFHYLEKGLTFEDDNFKQRLITKGLDFFNLLAHIEKNPNDEQWQYRKHPPTPARLLNICLRHKELLSAYGWKDLFLNLEKATGKDKLLSLYDYQKDLGTNSLLE
jgi:hypothetical protein